MSRKSLLKKHSSKKKQNYLRTKGRRRHGGVETDRVVKRIVTKERNPFRQLIVQVQKGRS